MSQPVNACLEVWMPFNIVFRSSLVAVLLSLPAQGIAAVMLAGGHLPVCSSMSQEHCASNKTWPEESLRGHRYQISDSGILRWALAQSQRSDDAELLPWLAVLRSLVTEDSLTRGELIERIRSAEVTWELTDRDQSGTALGEDLYQQIDDTAWWGLMDHLQMAVGNQTEQVRLDDSRQQATIDIFRRFVAMAAEKSDRERPLIAVSTAASRDPYDALDFYLQVFEQAGAEVIWLPLDAAVRRARSDRSCPDLARYQSTELGSQDRQRVWPAHFLSQLAFCHSLDAGLEIVTDIDGLFLNGGDQWLTLNAFRDPSGQATPELSVLLRRLEQGEMVIGGTSAGAAVQSTRHMISNGSNSSALLHGAVASPPPDPGCRRARSCPEGLTGDSLTHHPQGGLGSSPFGVVDTHFSERQRQFRLLQLLIESEQRYGLGIDETTALLVTPLGASDLAAVAGNDESSNSKQDRQRFALEVIGAQAAWLIDTGPAVVQASQPLDVYSVKLLRIPGGSRVKFDLSTGIVSTLSENREFPQQACTVLTTNQSFNELLETETGETHARGRCHILSLSDTHRARGLIELGNSKENRALPMTWRLRVEAKD